MNASSEPGEQDAVADPMVAEAAFALGLATFRHDYRTDSIVWSVNAESVLGLNRYELPLSARAFERLLPPQSLTLRLPARPPEKLPADRPGPHYRVAYELLPRAGRAFGQSVVEEGRWIADADGAIVGCLGGVRAVERTIEAGEPLEGGERVRPGRILPREDLLAVLDSSVRSLSAGSGRKAMFMLIAIADIGRLNANYGYETGDRAIAAVRRIVNRRMRLGDILGHLTGPKFGAILYDCDEASGETAAHRFRTAVLDEPIDVDGTAIRCDIVVGAVSLPLDAVSGQAAAIRAEEALVEARADAERRFALYRPSPLREAERRRNVEYAATIRLGLDEGRFILAYQPVVDARTRSLISYEALSRLVMPDGMLVSGGPYVGYAERLGLVRRIDRRSLELVLADLAACPGLRLGVNVSAETIGDPEWLATLAAAGRGDVLERLTIELTETAAMASIEDLVGVVATLRSLGCRIAIDDFGSGHTSLKVLRDVKPDWVKIDGAYVRGLPDDPDAVVYVEMLTRLAAHFGIRTVAEFVQDEASAVLLTGLGVSALQGRYVGEPLLRWSAEAAALVSGDKPATEREADGYSVVAGVLKGILSVGGARGYAF
jgi:diguanylate cyclase (GGDEF)-like protein